MNVFLSIILAAFAITLAVWVAVLLLFFKKELLKKIVFFLVALSAGAMMGGAFFHLLPEAAESLKPDAMFSVVLLAFVLFFFIEKVFHWRHCHDGECKIHTFGYMNLLGDGVHNFIDGLVIAATFLVDFNLGIVTTLVVALHEIPQEIGDFGVLIHAGFKKWRVLIMNYIVALTVVLGGLVGYFLSSSLDSLIPYLLPFAAGGFIYIAASDLIPEIKKETRLARSAGALAVFILGIILMFLSKTLGE